MPVTTEEPVAVPQLPLGPHANYFRVAAFHLGVLATHSRGYVVVFEVSCQADLITEPEYYPPPSAAQLEELKAKVQGLELDDPAYKEALEEQRACEKLIASDTGPPPRSWQAVGSWSQIVDPGQLPGLTIDSADYAAVFEKVEAHLIEAGIFPKGERTEV